MNTPNQTLGWGEVRDGLKTIYKYSKQYKKNLVVIFFFIILSSAIEAINPYIWGKLLDDITSKSEGVFVILGIYTALYIIQNFSDLKKTMSATWVEENIRLSYLNASFSHIFKLPLSFHKAARQGETNEKIRVAAQAIRNIYSKALLESTPQIITAIIMTIVVLVIKPLFGAIILAGLGLYLYISMKEIRPSFILQKESQKGYRIAGGMMQDAMTNIKSVKDSSTEEYEKDRIADTYEKRGFLKWYEMFKIRRRTNSIQGNIRIFMRTIIIFLSITFILNGTMTLGEMVTFVSYSMLIFMPLTSVFTNWRDVQDGIVSINEAEKLFKQQTEVYEPSSEVHRLEGKVTFENVSFFYHDTQPVLKNITFETYAGETVALVGESGVGKSTLIELLSGYHFAQEGKLLFDGKDVKEISLSTLRKNIAVVSQEISLFNDTIKYNLAYGSFDKTDEEIKEAARKAHCTDFIEKFPEKWEQVVGEKGLKLSVGQKQRVAIARAILKDPKILILDEPTSALDAGTEKIITESLQELMKGRTTFIVAHRLSTVRRADKILVFKEGRIIEEGKHEELIKIEKGEYRRLYELQIGLHD